MSDFGAQLPHSVSLPLEALDREILDLQAALWNLAASSQPSAIVEDFLKDLPTLAASQKSIEALLGRQRSDLGAQLTHFVSPLVALDNLAVKAAADFESSFAGVRKAAIKATEEQFARLSKAAMQDFNDFVAAARRMLTIDTGIAS